MIGKRIKALLAESGFSQAELSRKLSVPEYQVSNWVRGRSEPDVAAIKRIATALGVPVSRLMEDETAPTKRPKVPNSTRVNLVPHTARIPIWLSINAGDGEHGDDFTGQRDGDILVPEEYIQRKVFALRVAGDSMEPELREGDIALFEPLSPGARPSAKQIYAVEVQGWAEMVVKRVKTEHNQVILVSTNPLVKPIYLDPSLITIRIRGELLQSVTMWKTTAVLAEDAARYE